MARRQRVLMVFLDGVGIGRANRAVNPFFAARLPRLSELFGGQLPHLRNRRFRSPLATVVPLDATLGVSGLPQSGTGQTALFTGINAARVIGKHFGPYPYSSLKPVLFEHNLFRKLLRRGRNVFYANAYPQRYFDYVAEHNGRATATVLAWLSTGLPLNDYSMLASEKAIAADITNERWVSLGFGDVPLISPARAGERLVSLLESHDFVLYEFFYTDHAGHKQSMEKAIGILEMLDAFVGGIVNALDRKRMTLIVTSDHGNVEDLSTKTHTRNPVPLILVGSRSDFIASRSKKLTHITPAIVDVLA